MLFSLPDISDVNLILCHRLIRLWSSFCDKGHATSTATISMTMTVNVGVDKKSYSLKIGSCTAKISNFNIHFKGGDLRYIQYNIYVYNYIWYANILCIHTMSYILYNIYNTLIICAHKQAHKHAILILYIFTLINMY